MSNPKIKNFKEIAKITKNLRKKNKKIVTLNGSFDMLHPGHLHIITEAKKQGDILVVGLNSDKSYKSYKDRRGPIIDEAARASLLASLGMVDYVVLFDEPNPIEFLKKVSPNIHVNGAEYGKECVEAKTVISLGGKIHLVKNKDKNQYSTSNIISKIVKRYAQNDFKKAIFLDRDGILNKDTGYTHKIEDFEFKEGIIDALKYLQKLDYIFVIVTNQSGIGRGFYKKKDMDKFNLHLIKEFKSHTIDFEAIYYCPHDPQKDICDCRKPGSVLFQKAIKEHHINAKESFAIGDKISDCVAAKRMGIKTILLGKNNKDNSVDYVLKNLDQIKSIITR